jgi:hypothetical protein
LADVHLSTEQRRAFHLLIRAPRGITKATLLQVHGFTFELVTGLVRDGLAEVVTGTARAGGRTMQVSRVRITNAGRERSKAKGVLKLSLKVQPPWRGA